MPLKEKISKMTVVIDKTATMGEIRVAEAEFNMADFNYGEYKPVKLYLKKCAENDQLDIDPEQTYLDIGLKGTRARHLQVERKPSGNPFKSSKSMGMRPQMEESADMGAGIPGDRQSQNSALANMELDRLKKENKQMKKDHVRELTQKNTKINNLFTEIENLKTELSYSSSQKQKLQESLTNARDELGQIRQQLSTTEGELEEKEAQKKELEVELSMLKQ